MEKVIMPKKLTAENGAKALLMGEFTVLLPEECDECFGENEDCEVCAGAGQVMRRVNVPWTVIKEIYAKAVEHFSQPAKAADAEQRCVCPACGQPHPYRSDGINHGPCAAD